MSLTAILILLLVGLVAGYLAGLIWKGGGFGLLWNTVIGVIGSFLGGFIFRALGISFHGLIGSVIAALVGALVLLWIVSLVKKR